MPPTGSEPLIFDHRGQVRRQAPVRCPVKFCGGVLLLDDSRVVCSNGHSGARLPADLRETTTEASERERRELRAAWRAMSGSGS